MAFSSNNVPYLTLEQWLTSNSLEILEKIVNNYAQNDIQFAVVPIINRTSPFLNYAYTRRSLITGEKEKAPANLQEDILDFYRYLAYVEHTRNTDKISDKKRYDILRLSRRIRQGLKNFNQNYK